MEHLFSCKIVYLSYLKNKITNLICLNWSTLFKSRALSATNERNEYYA